MPSNLRLETRSCFSRRSGSGDKDDVIGGQGHSPLAFDPDPGKLYMRTLHQYFHWRAASSGDPPVTPLHEGNDDREQSSAHFGQEVIAPARLLTRRNPFKDSPLHEFTQPFGKDVVGYSNGLLKLPEAAGTEKHRLPDEQERPPLTDHLQRLRDRAVHANETLSLHILRSTGIILHHASCFVRKKTSQCTCVMQATLKEAIL